MYLCKAALLLIDAMNALLFFSHHLLSLFFSPSSDHCWYIVYRVFWMSCAKFWRPYGEVEETGRYIGYGNRNTFCPMLAPCLLVWNPSGYRLTHQNWWITTEDTLISTSETWTTVKRYFWQENSLNLALASAAGTFLNDKEPFKEISSSTPTCISTIV